MKMQQVLNLVRAEAERITDVGGMTIAREPDGEELRGMIHTMARMALRAASCPDADIAEVSHSASLCVSHRYLDKHCGACQEQERRRA